MRALARRADLGTDVGHGECDGQCDGLPESHDDGDIALDDDGRPALAAWPGGEVSPMCVPWASRAPWVDSVMRAAAWSNAGQSLGLLDAQTPALADAVVALRGEWTAIQAEQLERAREGRQ